MSSSSNIVIAFDLYGTLLSTESISKELATHFPRKADTIAALWRRYQLEYTWRLQSMNLYEPFDKVTRKSLEHALAESRLELSEENIESLMHSYDSLSTFPDTELALKALSSDSSIDAYIFSNGTDRMVSTSVTQSPGLASFASVFKNVITVDEIKAYKPDPRVYEHLVLKVGRSSKTESAGPDSVWLVSGNPFDVVGARNAGLKAAWVDRARGHSGNGGWNDRLGELAAGGPTVIVNGVDEAVRTIKKWAAEHPE